jgi:hypothetical protein
MLFLSACEAEKDFVKRNEITVKRFSMKDLAAKSNLKLGLAVSKIKSLNLKQDISDTNSKLVYNEKAGLYFDDEKGLYIENEELKSYTFPVIKTTVNDKIENICFNEKRDGTFDVFLIKYDLTLMEASILTDEEKKLKEKEFLLLMKNDVEVDLPRLECINIVLTTTIEYDIPIDEGDLTGNFGYTTVSNTTSVIIGTSCSFNFGSPGSGFNHGSGAGVGTGVGVAGASETANDIITGLNIYSPGNSLTEGDIFFYNYTDFISNLNPEQTIIFHSHPELINYLVGNHWSSSSRSFALWSINYLESNSNSQESIGFINTLINPSFINVGAEHHTLVNQNIAYLSQNNFSAESLHHISSVLENISNADHALIEDSETILVGPAAPSAKIPNIDSYLDCYDLSQNATFRLYVEQPTPNSNAPWSGNPINPDVGHTFISIQQGNITRVVGLYPASDVDLRNPSVAGAFFNDSDHEFDVSLSLIIDPVKLSNVINYIKGQVGAVYNLNTNNCTDFGLATIRIAGVNLPSAYGTWGVGVIGGAGDNPGQLGQNIRNMPLPSGAIRTTTSDNAITNSGSCN